MKQVDGTRILVQLITFQGGGIIILSLLMRGLDYLHLLFFHNYGINSSVRERGERKREDILFHIPTMAREKK